MSANYLFHAVTVCSFFGFFGYAVTVSIFSELFSYAATVFFLPELILHKNSVEGYVCEQRQFSLQGQNFSRIK